jgi:hypothetical protein
VENSRPNLEDTGEGLEGFGQVIGEGVSHETPKHIKTISNDIH